MEKTIQFDIVIARKIGLLLKNYYYLANKHYEDVEGCPEEMITTLEMLNLIKFKLNEQKLIGRLTEHGNVQDGGIP